MAAPDTSAVWGYVRLVPREGLESVERLAGASSGYEDRRYADAERVDYGRPGFAVVWLEGELPARRTQVLRVRDARDGARLEPALAAMGVGSVLRVENTTAHPQLVSCPRAGRVEQLAPGAALEMALAEPGEVDVYLPGPARGDARVFVAPGRFATVDASGRYALTGLAPGAGRLQAWHPRFPGHPREVELPPGRAARVDLELGVGLPESADVP